MHFIEICYLDKTIRNMKTNTEIWKYTVKDFRKYKELEYKKNKLKFDIGNQHMSQTIIMIYINITNFVLIS